MYVFSPSSHFPLSFLLVPPPSSFWISSPCFLPLSYLRWCCFIFLILSLEITLNFNKCKRQRNPESGTWTEAGDDPVSTISLLPQLKQNQSPNIYPKTPYAPQSSVEVTATHHSVMGLIQPPVSTLDHPHWSLFQKRSFPTNATGLLTLSLLFEAGSDERKMNKMPCLP